MTGPQHYAEAERQLEWVNGIAPGVDDEGVRVRLSMAQVHATLALAATQVAAAIMLKGDRHEWRMVTDPEYAAHHAGQVTR